jgi:hypothetical protein
MTDGRKIIDGLSDAIEHAKGMTEHSADTVERMAEAIFEAMRFAAEEGAPQGMAPPNWVSGGNSNMQGVARQHARAALSALTVEDAAKVSDEDRENIVDEIESIICETHEMDVRDMDYAENIVSWMEKHHPAALRAIADTPKEGE